MRTRMDLKYFTRCTEVMQGETNHKGLNVFFLHAVKMFFDAVNLGI